MEKNRKQRIVAWVSLVLTGAVLVWAVRVADQEFTGGVLMAFLSLIMIIITSVLFATSSKTSKRAPAETASKATDVVDLPAQPTTEAKSNEGLRKAAKALFILGAIFGAISIFMVVWAWYGYNISGQFAGSGGMGGIVIYAVLVVTVPATLLLMLIALILHSESRQQ
jgi:beta-lactamase regulating signal transducer with metallopeptidase domain